MLGNIFGDQCYQQGVNFTNIFFCKSRKAFVQIIIDALKANNIWQKCTKIMTWCKMCSLKYAINHHRNVGETEQHLLCHLCYAGDFVYCTNLLLKFTSGGRNWQLILHNSGLNGHHSTTVPPYF